jgi:putative multicomponent Na+:H+ antiporter subunit B
VIEMQDIVPLILQILLIIIALAIVLHEKNFTIIILISAFGLIAATLYAINKAPDVAIAEVAIGSAIIPLIYVISISRQREFIVLDRSRHGFIDPNEKLEGEVYELLDEFIKTYDLRINVCSDIEGSEFDLTNQLNVDLVISYDTLKNKYVLKGKESNILMKRLKDLTALHPHIEVEVFKDGDPID